MRRDLPSVRHNAFGSYHPAIVFGFFICAIILSVIVVNPLFLVSNLLCSAAYYLCVQGIRGLKTICALVPLFVFVSLVNPLFNGMGDTILFTWLGTRRYTLEALVYGMCTASMLVSAFLWFFSYNKVMTSEKFTYLFGHLAPSLSLLFTMVLRLVPMYQRKALEIAESRAGVGRSLGSGASWPLRAKEGLSIVSVLTAWALEKGIITADSMRSRGYGLGRRSFFARYSLGVRDALFLLVEIVLLALFAFCVVMGAGSVEFYPALSFGTPAIADTVGLCAYTAFLLAPSVVNVGEIVIWRISLSRI